MIEERKIADNIMKVHGEMLYINSCEHGETISGDDIANEYFKTFNNDRNIGTISLHSDAIRHYILCAGVYGGKFKYILSDTILRC